MLGSLMEEGKGGSQGDCHLCGLWRHAAIYCRKKDQYMIEQWRLWSHNGASQTEEEDWNHPHAGQRVEAHLGDKSDDQKYLVAWHHLAEELGEKLDSSNGCSECKQLI